MNVSDIKFKYITDKKGKRKSVVMPLKQFEELIEDLEDLAVVAERREEETISHKDLLKELKSNGFL